MNKKIIKVFFIIVVVIFLVELLYLIANKFILKPSNQTANPTSLIPSRGALPESAWKILSQKSDDPEGRTIVYSVNGSNSLSGSGALTLPDGFRYIIGEFVSWKDASAERNPVMKLKDPLTGADLGQVLVTTLRGARPIGSGQYITSVFVQNLIKTEKGTSAEDTLEIIPGLREQSTLSTPTLKALIQPGDIIVIYPEFDTKNKTYNIIKDDNGTMIAQTIILRRWNGNKDL